MLRKKDRKGVVEIFRIQAEGFSLWAVLVSLKAGRFLVHGWTRFKNNEGSYFYSGADDRDPLPDRLLSACRPIAAFYGAELVHQKNQCSGREKTESPSGCSQANWFIRVAYHINTVCF